MGAPPVSAKPRTPEECVCEEAYEIGRIVAEIRINMGLTQGKVALIAEVAPQTVQTIESGTRSYSFLSLVKVLAALGLELEVMDAS